MKIITDRLHPTTMLGVAVLLTTSCVFAPSASAQHVSLGVEIVVFEDIALSVGAPSVVYTNSGNLVFVTTPVDGALLVETSSTLFGEPVTVADPNAVDVSEVDVEVTGFSGAFVGAVAGQVGSRDVLRGGSLGGPFGNYDVIDAGTAADDFAVSAFSDASGSAIAFQRVVNTGPSDVRVSVDGVTSVSVSAGEQPVVTRGSAGFEVFYLRAGDLYRTPVDAVGAVGSEQLVVASVDAFDVARVDFGNETVLVTRTGAFLELRSDDGVSGFGAATSLVSDASGAVAISVRGSLVAAHYEAGSDVRLVTATAGVPAPSDLVGTGAAPTVFVDGNEGIHVAWRDGLQIKFRTDVPAPVAGFSVTTGSQGEAPLVADFQNSTTGVVSSYFWDFGDGSTSSSVSPSHLYTKQGSFTVSLTAVGPGGESSTSVAGAVDVDLPLNAIYIPETGIRPGDSALIPIRFQNDQPVQAFQVGLRYDGTLLDFGPDLNLAGSSTTLNTVPPDFVFFEVNESVTPAEAEVVVVIELPSAEFLGLAVAPGPDQLLGNLTATLDAASVPGTSVQLEIAASVGAGTPTNTLFSVSGVSVTPYFYACDIAVIDFTTPVFVRGDASNDGSVQLGDAIVILSFLFAGGPPPACPDAADLNDDGGLNLNDVIRLLGFLFAGGTTPPFPAILPGPDPTPDSLAPCVP